MAHSKYELVVRTGETIYGNKWLCDETEAKATIVIVHGMSEYSFRYDGFARFLNQNGYDVFALDHLGHGLNCPDQKALGDWPKDGFEQCVNNVADEVESLQKEGREVYVFGHSMGSFITQAFMEQYPGKVKKIVLCGSSGPQGAYGAGAIVGKLHALVKPHSPSKFMTKMSFGSYLKKIKPVRTPFDWLSWNEENVDKYIKDPYCGYVHSKMFFRSFIGNLAKLHKKANINRIDPKQKVLMIVGQDDPVGGYASTLKKLHSMYRGHGMDSTLIIYPHMRHEILNEDKKLDVMNDTLKFFEK
jgi:alpha-beta hydrolase superfamily lysophospholipase